MRHVRRDGIDQLKKSLKDKLITEDDEKRLTTEIQKVTDQFVSDVDAALAAKEKEIMQI